MGIIFEGQNFFINGIASFYVTTFWLLFLLFFKTIFTSRWIYMNVTNTTDFKLSHLTIIFRSVLCQLNIDEAVNVLITGWFLCSCYNACDDYWPLEIIMHGTHITECMKIAHASVCQTHIQRRCIRLFKGSLLLSIPPTRFCFFRKNRVQFLNYISFLYFNRCTI